MKLSDSAAKIRLQVFLSRNGVCSRRKAFDLVLGGRVSVNGQTVREPSTPVDPKKDKVCVDGREVKEKAYHYVLLNKPAGYVTTKSDPFAQKTVFDLLPRQFSHLSPVGRLDKDTEGLLLLTNDGDAAYRLSHPRFGVDKTYCVKIAGLLTAQQKSKIEEGVFVEGRKTAPAGIKDIQFLKNQTQMKIVIHEGRKRQIRLMFAQMGQKVVYLKRLSQGPLSLGALKIGRWRELTKEEIKILKEFKS